MQKCADNPKDGDDRVPKRSRSRQVVGKPIAYIGILTL